LVKLGEINLRDDTKIEQAEQLLRKAISIDNTISDAHVALGKVYEKLNKNDKAIEEFKMAVKLPKPSPNAHFHLGVLYEKKKQNKEATYQFKQCLSFD